jgi:hypothetical protein
MSIFIHVGDQITLSFKFQAQVFAHAQAIFIYNPMAQNGYPTLSLSIVM